MDGATKLALIGAKLKAEHDMGGVRRRITAAIRAEARPMANKTADRARRVLPRGGGLNDLVAGRRVTISTFMSARNAGVRLRKKDAASSQADRGYIGHKTYGRTPWQRQQVAQATGYWSQTLAESAHEVTPALMAVIDKMAAEIGAI